MKPTSLADLKLNRELLGANSALNVMPVNALQPSKTYRSIRNDEIRQVIKQMGFEKVVNPSDLELDYVNSVFQNKGFHQIDSVTFESVKNIAKTQFDDLNNKMKQFLQSMKGVETTGIYDLISEVSTGVKNADLEGIFNKAVNAKPSLLALFLSLFDKNAKDRSIASKLTELSQSIGIKSGNLDNVLSVIEDKLKQQQSQQEKNILELEKTFEVYYNAFIELRKQFALTVYLEYSYKAQLDQYKAEHQNVSDLMINKQVIDYENIYTDIQNKRAILQKALAMLPIIHTQNVNLVQVCKTLLGEIDNTLTHSFPMIRANLHTVAKSISAQRAMIGNENAKDLEENIANMASMATANLAVKATTLASSARLREANTVKKLTSDLKNLQNQLDSAKMQSQNEMAQAHQIMMTATDELKEIFKV